MYAVFFFRKIWLEESSPYQKQIVTFEFKLFKERYVQSSKLIWGKMGEKM